MLPMHYVTENNSDVDSEWKWESWLAVAGLGKPPHAENRRNCPGLDHLCTLRYAQSCSLASWVPVRAGGNGFIP